MLGHGRWRRHGLKSGRLRPPILMRRFGRMAVFHGSSDPPVEEPGRIREKMLLLAIGVMHGHMHGVMLGADVPGQLGTQGTELFFAVGIVDFDHVSASSID